MAKILYSVTNTTSGPLDIGGITFTSGVNKAFVTEEDSTLDKLVNIAAVKGLVVVSSTQVTEDSAPKQLALSKDGTLVTSKGEILALSEVIGVVKVTATATVKNAACEYGGFIVINPGTGGTVTVYNALGVDANNIITPSTPLTAGLRYEPLRLQALTAGCHVVIGGTGVDVNILVN